MRSTSSLISQRFRRQIRELEFTFRSAHRGEETCAALAGERYINLIFCGTSSGCRVCLLRCRRCRIQFAVSLLDSSGAEMALHCDADMVRPIVGARLVKFPSGPADSQGQDALA